MKFKIRSLIKLGNLPVHINDTHKEAVEMAQIYFNDNSLFMLCNIILPSYTMSFNSLIENFKELVISNGSKIEDFCIIDTDFFKKTKLDNLKVIYIGDKTKVFDKRIHIINEDFLKSYSYVTTDFILKPNFFFYYNNVKIAFPLVLPQNKLWFFQSIKYYKYIPFLDFFVYLLISGKTYSYSLQKNIELLDDWHNATCVAL
ncbi:MAG: hypothetical protein LBD57_04065 [Endomicrobium sp.]|uniref:hypothetical protein n=1 Tax=Candidatus Endomicrobiellum cubanum TaxID=3242325 RepID=UPI002821C4A6|nr:hypothetical protein [Endomicrobium sp.]